MELSGEQRIPVGRQDVWQALNDPEVLRQCITGCETVEKVSETEFSVSVAAKVGPVSAKFKGSVTLSDLAPPNGYTISGQGSGGVAGFGKGSAKVTLEDVGSDTILRYVASASVGGKLAQIGSRIVDGIARKMADEFFAKFNEILTQRLASETRDEAIPETIREDLESEALPALAEKARAFNPMLWGTGIIVVVVILLYFASR